MSPRSFWTILLKALGIYILLQGLLAIPAIINMAEIFYAESFPANSTQSSSFALIYFLLVLGIYGLIIWGFIFRTDWIINKLKLNKGIIEEKLNFSMHRSDILKILIMAIGGLTLIDALPAACQELLMCIQKMDEYKGFKKDPTSAYLLYHIIKTGIGIFMLTSSRLIVNFIEAKRRKTVTGDIIESE